MLTFGMRSLLSALLWAVTLPAQVERPDSLLRHRQLETSESGERNWAEFVPVPCDACDGSEKAECTSCDGGEHILAKTCATCRGKGKVSCTRCLGRGELRDPFAKMPCPRCASRERYECGICYGLGRRKIVDGGQPQCIGCGGKGGSKCDLCKGKREVAVIRAGARRLELATREQLDRAAKSLDALLVDVETAVQRLSSPAGGLGRGMNAQVPFDEVAKRAESMHKLWKGWRKRVERTAKLLQKTRGERLWGGRKQRTTLREFHDAACALRAWLRYQRSAIERCCERFRVSDK